MKWRLFRRQGGSEDEKAVPPEMLPAPLEDLEGRVDAAITDYKERATKTGSRMINIVPEAYQDHVRLLARIAYPAKNKGRNAGDFEDAVALNWLVKVSLFKSIGQQWGLHEARAVGSDEAKSGLALTKSASLFAFSAPDAAKKRRMMYDRISEREASTMPKDFTASLPGGVEVGSKIIVPSYQFHSSTVIEMMASGKAGDVSQEKSVQDMRRTFLAVDRKTML